VSPGLLDNTVPISARGSEGDTGM